MSQFLEVARRVLLLLFGLCVACWSSLWLPEVWFAAPARDATSKILIDDRFRPASLDRALVLLKVRPEYFAQRASVVRAEALIRLRLAEYSLGKKSSLEGDQEGAAVIGRLRSSLALNPSDSYLWLTLYSQEIARQGFDHSALRLLDESYVVGPLEGWISLRRNRLALAAFPTMSESMQAKIVSEFASLVDSDFVETAAENLLGVGWDQRVQLLASLKDTEMVSRERFARILAREGANVAVPGVQSDDRWWR